MRAQAILRLVLACGALAACERAETGGVGDAELSSAALFSYQWTLGSMRSAADTTLLMPSDLEVGDSLIVVADRAAPDVRMVGADGELRKVFGRRGSGPGEFQDIRGIALSPKGEVAVSDSRNRRVSIFGRDGALQVEIPLTGGRLGSVAFDFLGRLHVDRRGPIDGSIGAGGPTVAVYSTRGELLFSYGSYEPNVDPFGDAFLNQAQHAPVEGGGVWLLYPYKGVLELRDAEGVTKRRITLPPPKGRPVDGPFVEPVGGKPGSMMVVRMPVADDLAVDEHGNVYVAVLQTPEGKRMYTEILVYDRHGKLLGSQMLNRPTRKIAVSGSQLYALRESQTTLPGIDVYEILGPSTES